MVPIDIDRSPKSGGSRLQTKHFKGGLAAAKPQNRPGYLAITFLVDSAGSVFDGSIDADKFPELIRQMFEADAAAAMKAIGEVLSEVSVADYVAPAAKSAA